jgi:hypothetical protein
MGRVVTSSSGGAGDHAQPVLGQDVEDEIAALLDPLVVLVGATFLGSAVARPS